MTKRSRTLLFFILLFCFLVIAPSIVFYSWGYRLNFETKKIVKTGAFYFKVLPKSAQVELTPFDVKGSLAKKAKLLKKTDFFFGSILVENLLPKRYEIEIKKEGFYPWRKILEIKENQVTEAKNIVLMPEDIGLELLTKEVEDFFFSPDEKIIILKETAKSSSASSPPNSSSASWSLKIFDLEKNVESHLMESKDISKDTEINLLGLPSMTTSTRFAIKDFPKENPVEVALLGLKFSPDSKRLLLKVNVKKRVNPVRKGSELYSSPPQGAGPSNGVRYYLLDLNQASSKIIRLDFLDEESEEVFFHPQNPQKLFVFKKGEIFEADLTRREISSKLLENIRSFRIFSEDLYYLNNSGFLFKTDFSFSNLEKINKQPFLLEKDLSYKIDVFLDWIFISDGQKIYFFNPELDSFEKFGDTKQLKISPNSKKIVHYSDYEIWILFLKPEIGQPQKQSKEQMLVARFSEKIGEVFFLTDHYLIFNSGNKIKIAEIDDRDIINIVDLAEFESPKLFWNQKYKKLFILSNGNFYSSKALIP